MAQLSGTSRMKDGMTSRVRCARAVLTTLWPRSPCPTCRTIPALVGVEDAAACPMFPAICPDCGRAIPSVVCLVCDGCADIAAAI